MRRLYIKKAMQLSDTSKLHLFAYIVNEIYLKYLQNEENTTEKFRTRITSLVVDTLVVVDLIFDLN